MVHKVMIRSQPVNRLDVSVKIAVRLLCCQRAVFPIDGGKSTAYEPNAAWKVQYWEILTAREQVAGKC